VTVTLAELFERGQLLRYSPVTYVFIQALKTLEKDVVTSEVVDLLSEKLSDTQICDKDND
jgi:hypothetical protein